MERRDRPDSRWLRESWDLLGVVLDSEYPSSEARRCIRQSDHGEQYLWSGFKVRLHRDELESYFHNLQSPEPKIFVITHRDAEGAPEPFLVSLSYDEANAYETGAKWCTAPHFRQSCTPGSNSTCWRTMLLSAGSSASGIVPARGVSVREASVSESRRKIRVAG
jgi:hypothetical protein